MSELPIPLNDKIVLGPRPALPQAVREFVQSFREIADDGTWRDQMTPGLRGAMVGFLDKYSGGKMYRYSILKYIFDYKFPAGVVVSSKGLVGVEWMGLYQWIVPGKATPTSKWACHPSLEDECSAILLEMAKSKPYKKTSDEFLEELGYPKENE